MTVQKIRESINLKIYGSKSIVIRISRSIIALVSLFTLAGLIYYHGFPQTEESRYYLLMLVQISFAFYILNYLIGIFYSFEPLNLIKQTWFEGLLMLFLIIEGISYNAFDALLLSKLFIQMGIKNIVHYYAIFIQFYFLTVVLVKLAKSSNVFPRLRIHPNFIFISFFIILITGGAGLLMLPEMTSIRGSMPFIDAIFTATSATCVTGLTIYDTPTYFTFKGQLIILALIKLGGLNVIAFGSFVALASKFGVGVKQRNTLEDFMNKDSILSSKGMIARVFMWSVSIEIIGSLLLFLFWSDDIPFRSTGERVFFSVFHSVASVNNAGFSMFTDGLNNVLVRENYVVHNIISVLVFFGALGFMTIFDIFGINKIRERAKFHWKSLAFSSKIALYFSIGLVIFGAVAFYFLESDNTLKGKSAMGIITTSLLHSVVTRTAGFNTVDIGAVRVPMLVVMLFLMFIGASSSSTGGGVKTSTFALLWASTISTIRGRKNTELFQRTISKELIFRAYSVFLFYVVGNMICIFLLSISESHILASEGRSLLDLIFEEVSAFSTVGLSTGITSSLSFMGKCIIIASMFLGRIGMLSLAFALIHEPVVASYKYQEGHTMVG